MQTAESEQADLKCFCYLFMTKMNANKPNMTTKQDINEKFELRRSGVECPMCPDSDGADVIARLPSGRVHLQNDADYQGYCILVFNRHVVELCDLTAQERSQFMEDLSKTSAAIMAHCRPAKLNTSMLGNMVPHLHCHIMPRYLDNPDWGHPPSYKRPAERTLLSDEEYSALHSALSEALAK